jgi:hypothetical protein
MPNLLYYSFILLRNTTNSTTIIVTLLETDASNINNMLFPAPIPIITTIELLCCIIAYITSFCMLQNITLSPTKFYNLASMSTKRIIF